jgi:hypothetical protein
MAKLVKSNKDKWVVVDNDAIFLNRDGNLVNRDGTLAIPDGKQRRVFGCSDGIPGENSGFLGYVYFDGESFMFHSGWEEEGAQHTSDHLREIADLMDSLAEKADATKA